VKHFVPGEHFAFTVHTSNIITAPQSHAPGPEQRGGLRRGE
jgi:hypothetical protein